MAAMITNLRNFYIFPSAHEFHVDRVCQAQKWRDTTAVEHETLFLIFSLRTFRGLSQFIDETFLERAQLETLQPSFIHQSTSLDGIRNIKIYIVFSSLSLHVLFSLMRKA